MFQPKLILIINAFGIGNLVVVEIEYKKEKQKKE